MGKLVVFLPDGTTRDVLLDKERVTIGRRADNDVCLPYPPVSGEHAQVLTILADSFLEDLGSTNGTLVNGRAIAKHVLNDHDQIDIGRQRLTYLSDNDAKADVLGADPSRHEIRGLTEKVEPARPSRDVDEPSVGERMSGSSPGPLVADLERNIPRGPSLGMPPPPPVPPTPQASPVRIADLLPPAVAPSLPQAAVVPSAAAATPPPSPVPSQPVTPTAPPAAPAAPRSAPGPSVKVLSGASQGRIVPFPGPELTVGRVGVQVAIVRKVPEGFLLIPVEGKEPPRINGAAVAPAGSALHPGDTFEVAGVRLELSGHA